MQQKFLSSSFRYSQQDNIVWAIKGTPDVIRELDANPWS